MESPKPYRGSQKHAELKAVSEAMKIRQDQLVSLSETKDEFITLASHQLRTPATVIKQYLGLLLEGMQGDVTPGQREFLEVAYESNEKLIMIINDLLGVAQVDAGKVILDKSRTSVRELLDEVIEQQGLICTQHRQRIVYRPGKAKLVANIDSLLIRMVFENLLDNARKYSERGQLITVTIAKDGPVIKIVVADQGVGISERDKPKLFQKFSRINNPLTAEVGGMGIGLYWAKKIIELHGGDIWAESVRGQGSAFSVIIPA